MSGGGSCGLYCFCCGIFRKQTEYVTDGEIQNTNSEGDTVGTGRHSPPLDPNYRSDSNRALTTENTDVEQGQEAIADTSLHPSQVVTGMVLQPQTITTRKEY